MQMLQLRRLVAGTIESSPFVVEHQYYPGMLTILMKSIANNNTNTFVTILFTVFYIQQRLFFPR